MDFNFTYDNLQKVLEDYAIEARNLYQDKLIQADAITSGELLNSVSYSVKQMGNEYIVTLDLQPYWKYIEEGVKGTGNPNSPYNNPGWRAFPHILKWVTAKPVIPHPDGAGRIPTPNQLAYLITRSIAEKGTKPRKALSSTIEELNDKYQELIAEAMRKDLDRYLSLLF